MFKKIVTIFAAISMVATAFAQRDTMPIYQGWGLQSSNIDNPAYCLADKVNVRDKPNNAAKIIANLPIGTPVTIIEKKEEPPKFKTNGLEAPFLQVRFTENGATKTGYIWGGLLTQTKIQSIDDPSVYFLMGASKVVTKKEDDYEWSNITAQIRAVKNGTELSKVEFETGASAYHSFAGLSAGKHGLTNVKDVLLMETTGSACGEPNNTMMIMWNGQKLIYASINKSMSDVPMFYREEWIFPNEKGGKPNQIIWTALGGEYAEEEGGKDKIDTNKKVVYKWNGSKLVK